MKKPFSEMSHDELQTLYETVKAADDALLTELFGIGETDVYDLDEIRAEIGARR